MTRWLCLLALIAGCRGEMSEVAPDLDAGPALAHDGAPADAGLAPRLDDASADAGGAGHDDAATGPADAGHAPSARGASPGWPIDPHADARLVFLEDYEEGDCERIREGSSAAVVSAADGADVLAGVYSLRGNFDPDTTDPITGRRGESRYANLENIPLASLGIGRRMYVSYGWRLDADNRFEAEPPSSFGGQKHAYITGTASPWAEKVNYVVGQAWGPRHWWVVNNSPNRDSIGYHADATVTDAQGRLGQWHRVEYYLELESAPGAGDGVAIVKIDGEVVIDARDVPYLWPGAAEQGWGDVALPSMFGGGTDPAASFGWQMDELQIWSGLPPPAE